MSRPPNRNSHSGEPGPDASGMPAHRYRGIRRAVRSPSERCTSPEDELARSLNYIESTYCQDIKPLKDLYKNFSVSLDYLEQYVFILRKGAICDRINYAHAGLLLQSSKEVYSRKVDYLEQLLDRLLRGAANVQNDQLAEEAFLLDYEEHNDDEQAAAARRLRINNNPYSEDDEFRLIEKAEIPLLPETLRDVNFNLPRTLRLPPILPQILPPSVRYQVWLTDSKNEYMGRKGDFRVNWHINEEGIPIDLDRELAEENATAAFVFMEPVSPSNDCDTGYDESSEPANEVPSTPVPMEHDYISTPVHHGVNGNKRMPSPIFSLPIRQKRLKKVLLPPPTMTLTEFMHGAKSKLIGPAEKTKKSRKNTGKQPLPKRAKIAKTVTPEKCEDQSLELGLLEEASLADLGCPQSPICDSPSPLPTSPFPEVAENGFAEAVNDPQVPDSFRSGTPDPGSAAADLRYERWLNRIRPVIRSLDASNRFNLRETAKSLVNTMEVKQTIPLNEVISNTIPRQVSRNFVALLQLCNTRNVDITEEPSVTLLKKEFKLPAEDEIRPESEVLGDFEDVDIGIDEIEELIN